MPQIYTCNYAKKVDLDNTFDYMLFKNLSQI